MNTNLKKVGIILLTGSILFSQNAFAARMGSGKNSGMQRNVNTQQYSNSQSGANSGNAGGYAAQPTGQQRNGPGMGAVVAGAAAGAVGGYMLGKAMNSDKSNSSQVVREAAPSSTSNIPWGIIAILGMLLFIGLMIFRRKTMPQGQGASNPFGTATGSAPVNNNFEIPGIRKDNVAYTPQSQQPQPGVGGNTQQQGNIQSQIPAGMERMADGVESQYFLRQAKGMFLHIQSMNTPENVGEVEKYMTPELYQELKQMISGNDYVADFSQLDSQLMQSTVENNNYVASVRFYGKVSESPTSPAVDFNEMWHFTKPIQGENTKWRVAGIQQLNVN
ncbi:Tim44 domain-containing protein [Aquella oligotrophica]|nr:TIM44-like domain-containing protein [Aquella oligotrophica]